MNGQAQSGTAMLGASFLGDSIELAFLRQVEEQWEPIRREFPAWYADFEDIDPFVAERAFVQHLLETAPTEYARGVVVGIMLIRQQIAMVTGRGF